MRRALLPAVALAALVVSRPAHALDPVQSFRYLVTGNGFGFQVFDVAAGAVKSFLERPYRYLSANPANPDPTKRVRFGEQSWDEMFIGYMVYADATTK